MVATAGFNVNEQVVKYHDVGLISLLAEDANAARRFVDEELGALARQRCRIGGASHDAADISATWLSTCDTANALYLHRNTVAERLKRAESLLPVPLAAAPPANRECIAAFGGDVRPGVEPITTSPGSQDAGLFVARYHQQEP